MKVMLVTRFASMLNTSRIDSFHCAMFHGVGHRREKTDYELSTVEHPACSSLELTINKYRLNKIIQPSLSIIVIDDIARILEEKYCIKSNIVIVKKVVCIEYEEGSMKHWDNPNYRDRGDMPERLMRLAAQKSQIKWNGPPLKELIPHDGETLVARNSVGAFSHEINFSQIGEVIVLSGSISALEKYGLLWSDGIHCFRDDVFEILRRDLNPDYFAVQPFSL